MKNIFDAKSLTEMYDINLSNTIEIISCQFTLMKRLINNQIDAIDKFKQSIFLR